jgi:hypothetical protein
LRGACDHRPLRGINKLITQRLHSTAESVSGQVRKNSGPPLSTSRSAAAFRDLAQADGRRRKAMAAAPNTATAAKAPTVMTGTLTAMYDDFGIWIEESSSKIPHDSGPLTNSGPTAISEAAEGGQ